MLDLNGNEIRMSALAKWTIDAYLIHSVCQKYRSTQRRPTIVREDRQVSSRSSAAGCPRRLRRPHRVCRCRQPFRWTAALRPVPISADIPEYGAPVFNRENYEYVASTVPTPRHTQEHRRSEPGGRSKGREQFHLVLCVVSTLCPVCVHIASRRTPSPPTLSVTATLGVAGTFSPGVLNFSR